MSSLLRFVPLWGGRLERIHVSEDADRLSCLLKYSHGARPWVFPERAVPVWAMSIVCEQVAHVAQQRASVATLAKQLCLVVRARLVRLVAALLAVPVLALAHTTIGRRIVVGLVLAHEALVARPRLNQHAVHTAVFAREVVARMRRLHRPVEQTHDDIVREHPVAVLVEHRAVPHGTVHRPADKSTKRHVVGDLLHRHALASNRIQHLRQQRTNQFLGRNARPAAFRVALVHARKCTDHTFARVVQSDENRPQRMTGRHEVIELGRREHRFGVAVSAMHCSGVRVIRFLVSMRTLWT